MTETKRKETDILFHMLEVFGDRSKNKTLKNKADMVF